MPSFPGEDQGSGRGCGALVEGRMSSFPGKTRDRGRLNRATACLLSFKLGRPGICPHRPAATAPVMNFASSLIRKFTASTTDSTGRDAAMKARQGHITQDFLLDFIGRPVLGGDRVNHALVDHPVRHDRPRANGIEPNPAPPAITTLRSSIRAPLLPARPLPSAAREFGDTGQRPLHADVGGRGYGAGFKVHTRAIASEEIAGQGVPPVRATRTSWPSRIRAEAFP